MFQYLATMDFEFPCKKEEKTYVSGTQEYNHVDHVSFSAGTFSTDMFLSFFATFVMFEKMTPTC